MFFDEPTYLSDPDCQAHFVPALSSIFWDAVSIPTKQFEWFEIHGKWYIDKRVLFLFSGLESEIVHFSVVFIDFPKALINFSMVFIYCPWFSVVYPRCLTISSWLSESMFSMGFIHVHWLFHCFHQLLQRSSSIFCLRFFLPLIFPWCSAISPWLALMFNCCHQFLQGFLCFFHKIIHVFHQCCHGAHGFSLYLSMVFIDFA